ncbi:MAG: hypothetical protein GY944_10140 [bacterium]|nr:hypothetical protein [bacterium]
MRKFTPTTRPSARADLASWYEAIFREQDRHGLSMRELAEQIGISLYTLYAWRRRLSEEEPSDDHEVPGLLEVRVRRDDAASELRAGSSGRLILRIGREREIEIPPGFDSFELARLLGVLESC